MAGLAPRGPLRGDELRRATELLTQQEQIAYGHRRAGQSWNWIAERLGVSRTRVIHLCARAEEKLGYERTLTKKQKARYKPAAVRERERDERLAAYLGRLEAQLHPDDHERLLELFDDSISIEERNRRVDEWLVELEAERRERERDHLPAGAEHGDDWSRTVVQDAAEFAAELEADFGINEVTGDPMQPGDFIEDDGKGYDRL